MSVPGRTAHRRGRPLPVALGVLLAAAAGATAILPQQTGLLDLGTSEGSVRIIGAVAGDRAGDAVAAIGDHDGDGSRDLLIGAWQADPFGRAGAGAAYIAFGPFRGGDLGAPQGVIRIAGAAPGDGAGISVAPAGDVNGDGRPDLLIGALDTDNGGRTAAGSAYVVFGGNARTPVDLAALGTRGIRIDGAAAGDQLGASVAGVGDVDGDGFADVLVGARGADHNGRPDSGAAYLILGSASPAGVDTAVPNPRVIRIDGAAAGDQLGSRVAAAGDVNGDGRPDLLVSAPTHDPGGPAAGRVDAGAVYVVFGGSGMTALDLGGPQAATRSLRIDGPSAGDQLGFALAAVGDSDGDGRGEVLVGAPRADAAGRVDNGALFFVRGSSDTTPVNLGDLGARSVRVDGALSGDLLGSSAAYAGDVNGDGRGDLVVGANGVDAPGRANVGGAYLVTALPQAGRLDLSQPDGAATLVRGAGAGDQAGVAVGGAGDVTGDGRPDVFVGSRYADPGGRTDAGAIDVVLGFGATLLSYPAVPVSVRVGAAITPVGPVIVRRTGSGTFSISPALPAGLSMDPATGIISGTPQAPAGRRPYTVTITDLAGGATGVVDLEVLPTAAAAPRTVTRRVPITGFVTGCRRSRIVGRPCRIQLAFRIKTRIKVRVEVRRRGAKRPLGSFVVRTRAGVNRYVLPSRIRRVPVGRGVYEIRLKRVTVPVTVRPAVRRVAVTFRRGRPAR